MVRTHPPRLHGGADFQFHTGNITAKGPCSLFARPRYRDWPILEQGRVASNAGERLNVQSRHCGLSGQRSWVFFVVFHALGCKLAASWRFDDQMLVVSGCLAKEGWAGVCV